MKNRLPFFHGGVPNLPVGDYILPPCETGHDAAGRDNRVYFTIDLLQAINCALIEKGDVYLVQPIGRLGPDDSGIAGPHYTARRALILNRVSLPPRMVAFEYGSFDAFLNDVIDLYFALTDTRHCERDDARVNLAT
jgi:hypothetical protein